MPLEVSDSGELQEVRPSPSTSFVPIGPKDDNEISALDLLIVLAEGKQIILSMTAIFAMVAIVISFVLPKRYTAKVTLLPPQQSSASLSSMLASQIGGLGSVASLAGTSLGIKNPNEIYVAMLESRTVEDAMIERFDLMHEYKKRYISDARKLLEKNVNVDGSSKDGLIHISVEDSDPNRAAEMANGYVEEYRKLSEHLAITEAAERRLFFEKQLEHAKDNLASAEEDLKRTEQATGLIQLDSQAKALIESAAMLRAQVTAKEVQIQGIRTYATGENAQLVQAEKELESLRTQLAQLGGGSQDASDGLIVPKGRVPQAGLEYIRKLRDVKYYETIFGILARQFEAAKLDEAKQGAIIQVIDPAIPPDRRSAPKRSLIAIAGAAAGFLLGLVTVLVKAGIHDIGPNSETALKLQFLRSTLTSWRSKQ